MLFTQKPGVKVQISVEIEAELDGRVRRWGAEISQGKLQSVEVQESRIWRVTAIDGR